MAKCGSMPIPISPGSSNLTELRLVRRSFSRVVHCWPVTLTYCLSSWKEEGWLQAVAREMNLPMTAFLVKQSDHYDLRWFMPQVEEKLCGHATLASAHILWPQGDRRHLQGGRR